MRNNPTTHTFLRTPTPDLAPLAGFLLALSCFFLLIYSPRQPGQSLVLLEETPRQQRTACFNAPPSTAILIGLTATGRVSFATADAHLQTAVLQSIIKQYGICLSPAYTSRLKALPFLAAGIEQLPAVLATANYESTAISKASHYPALTAEQLLRCVVTAHELSPVGTRLPASIFLVVDARTDASKVMNLVHLLQQQGLSHLNLLAHSL